jgi:3'-5' exonuclease
MTFVYLDIETIPSQSPDLLAKFRAEVKPPATYKKPESIAEWMAENADKAAVEALAKTSFDPAYGHICSIGSAIGDGTVSVKHADGIGAEASIIRGFFESLPSKTSDALTFVGHYISGFDLRFILCRSVILGIPIPPQIPRDVKPWAQGIFDTMTAWAGARDTIGQDKLAQALGLEGKGDFDGSMVAAAWLAGEHDKIAEYCAKDVETVRNIHRRFVAVNW